MFLSHPSFKGLSLACAFLALPTPIALALPDDRAKEIRIVANKSLHDEKRGLTVYSGNVQLNQGSLHIRADEITVFRIVETGDKIVAKGNPATLQQQPKPEEQLMHAKAQTIEYYKNEDKIHLKDDAKLEQDGSIVTADSIDYFIANQVVKANSDDTAEDRGVTVVIPAGTIDKNESE